MILKHNKKNLVNYTNKGVVIYQPPKNVTTEPKIYISTLNGKKLITREGKYIIKK